MEIDIDEEIENVKTSYENELKGLYEYEKRLTITVFDVTYLGTQRWVYPPKRYHVMMKDSAAALILIVPGMWRPRGAHPPKF